jgi:hypothetical protein
MIQLKLSKISKQITYSSALSFSWVAAFFVGLRFARKTEAKGE